MTTLTAQRIIIIDNQIPPTISMSFDCNWINGNGGCTWLLLPTDRISSGLPAAPRLWLRASQERQPRLSIFPTGDDIMVPDYHLQRRHIQDTNWRIQSIDEIWIIRVFIFKAGTPSTPLSQYISLPAKLLLSIGRHYYPQSSWRYGMDSELWMDLLDVPISMYVLPDFRCCGPKPGNGRSVTVRVLPSTKQYTSLTASLMDCPRASWYVHAFVPRKHVCSAR